MSVAPVIYQTPHRGIIHTVTLPAVAAGQVCCTSSVTLFRSKSSFQKTTVDSRSSRAITSHGSGAVPDGSTRLVYSRHWFGARRSVWPIVTGLVKTLGSAKAKVDPATAG